MSRFGKIMGIPLSLAFVMGSVAIAEESGAAVGAEATPPAAEAPAAAPAADAAGAVPAADAAAPAADAPAVVEVEVIEVAVPAEDSGAAIATADAEAPAAAPAEAAGGLSVAEILARPPSEWDDLIEQKVEELAKQREASFPTIRIPWADPYDRMIEARMNRMEQRMEAQYRQLRKRVNRQQRMMSPMAGPGAQWSDYQRNLSRLQSLAEQERYNKMMQRNMRRMPSYPNYRAPAYPRYHGPWGR
jgi:hypothetical protein